MNYRALTVWSLLFALGMLVGMTLTAIETKHRLAIIEAIASDGGVER